MNWHCQWQADPVTLPAGARAPAAAARAGRGCPSHGRSLSPSAPRACATAPALPSPLHRAAQCPCSSLDAYHDIASCASVRCRHGVWQLPVTPSQCHKGPGGPGLGAASLVFAMRCGLNLQDAPAWRLHQHRLHLALVAIDPMVHMAAPSPEVTHYTALGSDGQGPKGFSFVFLDLFDFFDVFVDLARACLGFLERPSRSCEVVRVRMDCTIGQRPH